MAKERLQQHPASEAKANLGQKEAEREKASDKKLQKMGEKKPAKTPKRGAK